MKAIIKILGLSAAMMSAAIPTKAYDIEVDGLYYDIISTSDRTCALTSGDNAYSGIVNIPDSILMKGRYLKVVEIKDRTFFMSDEISELTIPKTVNKIDGKVFSSGCIIGKLNIVYSDVELTIGGYKDGPYSSSQWVSSLKNCHPKEIFLDRAMSSGFPSDESIEKLTIGKHLVVLPEHIFKGACKNLKYLCIEDCETPLTIEYEFEFCPDVYIGRNFSGRNFSYSNIEHLTLGQYVTVLKKSSFAVCLKLLTVEFNNIEEIGERAFHQCKLLASPVFPKSLKRLCHSCFDSCESIKEVILDCGVETIEPYAFSNCDKLEKIDIKGVKSIDINAFSYCENLSSVTLGEGLETIGERAFCKSNIENIAFPNSLKNIEKSSFYECSNLKKISLGNNVEQIGEYTFDSVELDSLIISAGTPPVIYESSFKQKAYLNCAVIVPTQSVNLYKSDKGWMNFWNIEGRDLPSSDIPFINIDSSVSDVVIYNLNGVRVNDNIRNLSPGIYIIRHGDKTFKIKI